MSDPTRQSGGLTSRVFRALEALYDPFASGRAATPPKALGAYFRWAYQGAEPAIVFLAVCAVANGVIEVLIMSGIGALLDRAGVSGPNSFFSDNSGFILGLLALVLIARPLAMTAQGAVTTLAVTPGLVTSSVWRLHRYVLGQSMRFFEDDFAGRLAQKEVQAGAATDMVTVDLITAFGMLISFVLAMLAALGLADWRLGLATLIWMISYAALLRWALPSIRETSRVRAERRAAVTGHLVDGIANIKTVKLFAPPGAEETAAQGALARYRRAAQDAGQATTRMRLALNVLNALSLTAMLALCLWLWTSGAVTLGDAAAASMLTLRLTAMSGWIAFTALGVSREIGTLEDALQTLAGPYELTDPDAPAVAPSPARNRLALENVSFHYSRPASADESAAEGVEDFPRARRVAALNDVSLVIEPGEKVGLVGPSGAGKSTLVSLLLRLYDVQSGRITVDGVDVRALPQADLRARFGVVTQDSALFNRSARDNILYGRPDAGAAAAEEAAQRARADEFIRGLKDIKGREGYAAFLGERGVKLSGGQRQRIALARAFLRDAPVLILDEATSALDSEVEAEVLAALNELMAGRTVIAIAHRLSTIAEMDRIVVLDQGRIVEQGSHSELIGANGLYARLWTRQSGGFLGEAAE